VEGIGKRADMVVNLMKHVKMEHKMPLRMKEATTKATKAEAMKICSEAEKIRAGQPADTEGRHAGGEESAQLILDKRVVILCPEVEMSQNRTGNFLSSMDLLQTFNKVNRNCRGTTSLGGMFDHVTDWCWCTNRPMRVDGES
jgi:hypothetical protein